mgnify:CR=1 FL=1|tara:strand:+ start:13057 stop:14883 length:1827 start_codon:yes stop_codon:yes gene_type:complete
MAVIGISCYFHDSAAAVISSNGDILGAASEERFTRKKYDSRFPICALDYCINLARDSGEEIEAYVYYEKPIWVFMRLLETYFTTAPRGFSSFLPSMKTWISNKIFTRKNLSDQISELDSDFNDTKLFFSEHHLSHACSAFYPSPFKESAILCLDAVGEFVTTSAWIGKNNKIDPLWEINFPNSLGMLYSSFTYYCGFKVNSGEYKLMGLAPYGEPKYVNLILDNLIDIKDDGSYKLHMKYFKFHRGLRMISNEFRKLFKNKERLPEEPITQFYMDLASSIQKVTEDLIIKIANNLYDSTKLDSICLSGGVALNCVANGKILDRTKFKNIWIQPAAGDAGSSLGAALGFNYLHKNNVRNVLNQDSMKSAYLGPKFTENTIESFLKEYDVKYQNFSDVDLYPFVAGKLAKANVVGWFQERMEFGPRALGNRSILGDPRIPDMQKTMNLKIKNRESFRPFAPVILEGFQKEYFGIEYESQYMLITRNLSKNFLLNKKSNSRGLNKVNDLRSTLPAITHVDNSCRVQTVSEDRNSKFYKLLKEFYEITGCPVLINTSFNVRGEPIVCTPEDAFLCFINTNIDILVLGNFVIDKKNIDPLIKHDFPKPYTIDD